MTFRPSGLIRGLCKPFFAGLAVCALWACISDGPNHTGGDYLNDGGITLDAPLHHFTFADFPVESTYTEEFNLSHEGDSFLVVGQESPFRAAARLGYKLDTPALRHRLRDDSALYLRIVKPELSTVGGAFLTASTVRWDSITLLIEAHSIPDSSGKMLSDSMTYHHRRMISTYVPFSTLPAANRTFDTARIALRAAFTTDSSDPIQVLPLPNLRRRLASDTTKNWLAYVEISPLPGSNDTGLFRFRGVTTDQFSPCLLLGAYAEGDTSKHPLSAQPYIFNYGNYALRAFNFKVTHSDKTQALLFGVTRGLHLRLNRKTLMDSIYARLGKTAPPESGRFSTEFFVPYAELKLPLADSLARVDGPFALDMRLTTDLDSVPPGKTISDTIPVLSGGVPVYLLSTYGISDVNRQNPIDSLYCYYGQHVSDSALRTVMFRWRKDSLYNDTFTVTPDGSYQEFNLRRLPIQTRGQIAALTAHPNHLSLHVLFSLGRLDEPNAFLDSAGQYLSSPVSYKSRFWRPGTSQITLRSTIGMRTLLNRHADTALSPDFLLRPYDRAAYDTSAYKLVNFPVLGKIDFPRTNGRIRATVNIYLFPLTRP